MHPYGEQYWEYPELTPGRFPEVAAFVTVTA